MLKVHHTIPDLIFFWQLAIWSLCAEDLESLGIDVDDHVAIAKAVAQKILRHFMPCDDVSVQRRYEAVDAVLRLYRDKAPDLLTGLVMFKPHVEELHSRQLESIKSKGV